MAEQQLVELCATVIAQANDLAVQDGVLRLEGELDAAQRLAEAGEPVAVSRNKANARWIGVGQGAEPVVLVSNSQSGWRRARDGRLPGGAGRSVLRFQYKYDLAEGPGIVFFW